MVMMGRGDTIFAEASGGGRAAVMIFRLSGPAVKDILMKLAGKVPAPRQATVLDIHTDKGALIDNALLLFFPAPRSYSGEDMAEIQCHGSRAIKTLLTKQLLAMEGVRMAEPGEFSFRAFQQGKINLVEAEGINDLAMAETEEQRKTALAQWRGDKGSLSDWLKEKRNELIELKAFYETAIEFGEEDVPSDIIDQGAQRLAEWIVATKKVADDDRAERRQRGITVAIIGAPNVGKSSLANLLARREVAIVSPEAGTTRDVIELHLDLFGHAVAFYDTAGLRRAKGKVEKIGVAKAEQLAELADIRILMKDIFLEGKDKVKIAKRKTDIVLANKVDIIDDAELKKKLTAFLDKDDILFSAKSEQGLDKLLKKLQSAIEKIAGGEQRGLTNERQRAALKQAVHHAELAYLQPHVELIAEEVTAALAPLDRLLGHTTADEMLGVIFSKFCIGK